MAAHQAPLSLGFSRQEHWSGLPFPSLMLESEVAQLCPTLRDPMDHSLPGSSVHGLFQARILEWGAIAFSTECTNIGYIIWAWRLFKASPAPVFLTCSEVWNHWSRTQAQSLQQMKGSDLYYILESGRRMSPARLLTIEGCGLKKKQGL